MTRCSTLFHSTLFHNDHTKRTLPMRLVDPKSLWLAAATMAAAATAHAADKVTYHLDWLPGGDKAPIYVCIQEGFCEAAGLEIVIEPGRGSSEAITRIATRTSDIGSAGISALMAIKVSKGVPVKAVMNIFNMGPLAFTTRRTAASPRSPMSKARPSPHIPLHLVECLPAAGSG